MNLLKISLSLLLCFIHCCTEDPTQSNEYETITLDEIYQDGITNYVDKEINLITKVYWDSLLNIRDGISDTTFAGLLRLKFDNADLYIEDNRFKGQNRGNLFILSENIEKKLDENLVEKYYFKEDSLSNSKLTYILNGKIQFRDWLEVTDEHLQDSVFINQCNDVVYWSQTFEFNLENILK